jgi:hypothetical protein
MTCAWQAGRQGFSVIARSSPLFGADAFFYSQRGELTPQFLSILLYTTERGAHSSTLMQFTPHNREGSSLLNTYAVYSTQQRGELTPQHLCSLLYNREGSSLLNTYVVYSTTERGAHSSTPM